MAVTIKEYMWLFERGNDPNVIGLNKLAAEGWEFVHGGRRLATDGSTQFGYLLARSAGQSETDVLVGTFTVGTSANTIIINSHGLANGALVRFALGPTTGDVLPAPLQAGIYYYVVNTRGNDFQVSLIAGGAAIDITSSGTGTDNQVWKK